MTELATTRENTKVSARQKAWENLDSAKHDKGEDSRIFDHIWSQKRPPQHSAVSSKQSKSYSRLSSVGREGNKALRTFNKNYRNVKDYLKELKSQIGYQPSHKTQGYASSLTERLQAPIFKEKAFKGMNRNHIKQGMSQRAITENYLKALTLK